MSILTRYGALLYSGQEDNTISISVVDWAFVSERGEFVTWDHVYTTDVPSITISSDNDLVVSVYNEVTVAEEVTPDVSDICVSIYDEIAVVDESDVSVQGESGPDLSISVSDEASTVDYVEVLDSALLITSTRWRIYMTDESFYVVSDCQMRSEVGGADQCNGGTAKASTHITEPTELPPSAAFDGSNSTAWQSTSGHAYEWLEYEFIAPVSIVEYYMLGAMWETTYLPNNFELQYYNGSQWVTADTQTGISWEYPGGDSKSFSFDPLWYSGLQASVVDTVTTDEDVTVSIEIADIGISIYDEVSIDESVSCEVPSLFGSVYDEVAVIGIVDGKTSDPQISLYDESSVSDTAVSLHCIEVSVYDEVTVVEDPASALSVEVWEDDPTSVEETISSFRNILAAGDIRDPGLGVKEIRIKLKAPAQNGYLVTGASIGVRDPGTEDYLPGTVSRITFDGGAVSAAVQQKDVWSDWVVFTAFDHTVDLMIHLDTALLDTVNWNQYSTKGDSYVKNGEWNDCMVEDISGYSLVNYSYNLKSLDVRASMVEGYDINVYDNESPSESVEGVTSGLEISIVDEVALEESVAGVISTALNLSVYDEITLSEEVSGIISAVLLEVNDNVSVSEAVDGITSLAGVSVYDEISVSDVPSVSYFTGTLSVSVYDEVTVSEAVELYHELYLSAVDTISVTDSPTVFVQLPFGAQVVEAVNVNDAVSVALSDISVSAHDTVVVGEDTSFSIFLSAVTYDSVSVLDVPTAVTSACIVSVSDEVSIAEAVTFAPEVVVTIHDTVNLTDAATAVVSDLNVNTADAVAVSDSPTISVALPGPIDVPVLYDSATVTDVVSLDVSGPQISVYDSITVVDDVDIFWELAAGLLSISAEGLVCIIDAEGESLEVEANEEVMGISSEGEAFGIAPEGQSLQIDTEVV